VFNKINNVNTIEILKKHKLSLTESRKSVLSVLLNNGPLPQSEIQNKAGLAMSRITIYRCLRVFVKKGIVSQLKDDNGKSKFFLNSETGKNHVHFKCNQCGQLLELEASGVNYRKMPPGYVAVKRNLFITGTCKACSSKSL
jgi:Fur family ferric uptake transcriptional regulator